MIFLILGLPEGISEFVSRRINWQINGHEFHDFSIRASHCMIEENECEYALRSADNIRNHVMDLCNSNMPCFALSFWRAPEKHLVELISPGVPLIKFSENKSCRMDKKKAQERVNQLSNKIEKSIGKIISYSKKLFKEMNKTNSSPLLLPLTHFDNSDVVNGVLELSEIDLENIQDIDPLSINKKIKSLANFGKSEYNRNCFIDDRNLIFQTPGTAKHGGANLHLSNPNMHKPSCHILSRLRLGQHIPEGFHYDCTYKNKKINEEFYSCHNQKISVNSKKYVNIYPNNFVRTGKK